MHHVRVLLLSALVTVGCAADDTLSSGVDGSGIAPASTVTEAASLPSTTADDAAGNVTVTTTQALAADATAPASTSRAPDTDSTDIAPTTAAPDSPGDGTETTDTATTASEAPAEPTASDTAAPTTAAPTTAAPTTQPPTTAAPEPSIDGFAVFLEATCDSCHRGDGDGTGADLQASTLERDAVIEVIRFGVAGTDMDGWDFEPKPPGLTRGEIEAVATYVMTLRSG